MKERFYNLKIKDEDIKHKLSLLEVTTVLDEIEFYGKELLYIVEWFPYKKKKKNNC